LKVVNVVAAKAQKWLKREKVWGMPYRYTIDPLNVCNLRCPLCPTGLGTLGRERGKMTPEQFYGLIDQVAPYAYSVEMYNWGEPFLHPQIFEMIKYASSKRIAVRLSSNMNRFSPEMAMKAVQSGLDAVLVSVDGATQEVYEKYRRGGNLERVLENVRMLVDAKKKAGSRTPFITLRMLVNKYNEDQIESMRQIADDLDVDAFTLGTTFVDTTDPKQIEEWLPKDEALSYYDYSSEKLENVWHCADLWESVTINWDGGLAPCCWLHEKGHDYENVYDRPLKEIWNGEAYVSSRRVFAFGGPKDGPVETICTVCKGRPLYLKD
jgi:MoaA/NifB/PqqE/SkfB family radical SAM enzyme